VPAIDGVLLRALPRATVLPGMALVVACIGEAGGRGSIERDSAGIVIVENFAPAWQGADAWEVVSPATVEIGVAEGEDVYQLFDVSGATRLGNGTIVVANAGTQEIRFCGADGRHLRTAGGSGRGPGESCRRAVRASQTRSIVYNVLAVSAAAAGWVNPLVAAVLMPLSSGMVILTASRVEAAVRKAEV